MSARLSVLQRVQPGDVQTEPFPYVVIENALPDELYAQLVASLPPAHSLGVDESRNNARWNFGAAQAQTSSVVPTLWKEFLAYHSSAAFYKEIVDLFWPSIHDYYPKHYPDKNFADSRRVGMREKDNFRHCDVLMDAMISGNTPVQSANSVRTTHIDNGSKLFSGLFYMRPEGDDSVGGDLEISAFKPQFRTDSERSARFTGEYIPDSDVTVVKTIKYQKNCLVLFINTVDSLHGVTVRQPTPNGRFFVNLVGEVVSKLYRLEQGRPVYVKLQRPLNEGGLPPMSVLWERVRGRKSA